MVPVGLKEYYAYYLTLHQNHLCRRMHFLGQIATLLFLYYIIATKQWILILLAPFVVYPFAWAGHKRYEKNRPAAFNDPIKAKISDWIMFKDIILGKLSI
jgi:hypothetical protein